MTAIAALVEKTHIVNRSSLPGLERAAAGLPGADNALDELLRKALEIAAALSNLLVPHFPLTFPPGEEKDNLTAVQGEAPREAGYALSLGPFNIFYMTQALQNAISEFGSQAAGIAGVYSVHGEGISGTVQPQAAARAQESMTVLHMTAPDRMADRERVDVHETDRSRELYRELQESALAVRELETICESLAGLHAGNIIRDSTVNQGAPVSMVTEKESTTGKNVLDSIRRFSENVIQLSDAADKTSNALQAALLMPGEPSGAPPVQPQPGGEESVRRRTGNVFEMPSIAPNNARAPGGGTASGNEKISSIVKTESYGKTLSSRIQALASATSQTGTMTYSPQSPQAAVPEALKTLMDYVNSSLMMQEYVSWTGHDMGSQDTIPLTIPVTAFLNAAPGTAAVSSIHPFASIEDSTAPAAALAGAAFDAMHGMPLESIAVSFLEASQMYQAQPAASLQNALGRVLQLVQVQAKEGDASRTAASQPNFNNTFNISVNVKGGGDESEMRELGRKIGLILSEELRRYGGIR